MCLIMFTTGPGRGEALFDCGTPEDAKGANAVRTGLCAEGPRLAHPAPAPNRGDGPDQAFVRAIAALLVGPPQSSWRSWVSELELAWPMPPRTGWAGPHRLATHTAEIRRLHRDDVAKAEIVRLLGGTSRTQNLGLIPPRHRSSHFFGAGSPKAPSRTTQPIGFLRSTPEAAFVRRLCPAKCHPEDGAPDTAFASLPDSRFRRDWSPAV